MGTAEVPSAGRRFDRGGDEFGRVLAFSDGLFAIAMTLLVIGIEVPKISDAESVGELADALGAQSDSLISFVISFAVIGRYWVAHHQMFSLLRSMDRGLIGLNLVYLLLIAFLPFPTALLGNYFDNPLAFGVYAVTAAAVSGMEVVLLRHAYRHDLLSTRIPARVYRWGTAMSLTPVVCFLASIPLAFVSSELAVLAWLSVIPISLVARRWGPEGQDRYFS